MIPFFFTHYKKAPLATCVSFCASMCYVVAALFSVGLLFNWSGIRDEMNIGTSLLVAVCFAAAGFGLTKLARWLAVRKQRKLSAKAGASPAPTVASAAASARRACPRCGAIVEPGDAFCVNCGTKL